MLWLEVIGSSRSEKALLTPALLGGAVWTVAARSLSVAAARVQLWPARRPWPPLRCAARCTRASAKPFIEHEIEFDRRRTRRIRWEAGTPCDLGLPARRTGGAQSTSREQAGEHELLELEPAHELTRPRASRAALLTIHSPRSAHSRMGKGIALGAPANSGGGRSHAFVLREHESPWRAGTP